MYLAVFETFLSFQEFHLSETHENFDHKEFSICMMSQNESNEMSSEFYSCLILIIILILTLISEW